MVISWRKPWILTAGRDFPGEGNDPGPGSRQARVGGYTRSSSVNTASAGRSFRKSAIFFILFQQGEDRKAKRKRCAGMLGGGLEPPCLAAYAPQTYVSAISPPERASANLIRNAGKQEGAARNNLEARKPGKRNQRSEA